MSRRTTRAAARPRSPDTPITDRLSEEDLRELARLVRVIHADAEAWRERERLNDPRQDDQARTGERDGDHDGTG